MKLLDEWFVDAPWGKIALASWGSPNGDPILLVHGRQDSLNTFLPLLQYLPERYYYVALDLPGSGKSDDFPVGIMLQRFLPIAALDVALRHLKWNQFIYIGHSMGAELGLLYNAINPNRIIKLVLLDVKPGLLRLQVHDFPKYFKSFYDEYYSNYDKYNTDDRRYTKEGAMQAVMKARNMTRAQAEVILARNLAKDGDMYRLSWDKRQKILAPLNMLPTDYMHLFSVNQPPTLYINANHTSNVFYNQGHAALDSIMSYLLKNVKCLRTFEVQGSHDVHFMHPERIEKVVCQFLEADFGLKSKL